MSALLQFPQTERPADAVPTMHAMVRADGTIDEDAVRRLAEHRARLGYGCALVQRIPTTWRAELDAEIAFARRQAEDLAAAKRERAAFDARSLRDRLIASLWFEIEKLEHGLAQPRDPAAIARAREALRVAEAQQ